MQITPPFGYDDIVPLEKHHKVLLPAATGGSAPGFARRINAMAISFSLPQVLHLTTVPRESRFPTHAGAATEPAAT